MKRYFLIQLCCLFLISGFAYGADVDSKFAVKGAGISTCKRYLDAYEEKKELYYTYGGWLDGYITGANQHLGDTYDIAPWQSTGLLLTMMASNCKKHQDMSFYQVAQLMVQELVKTRIKSAGRYGVIQGGSPVPLHEEIVRRIKSALKDRGFYDGNIHVATWDDEVKTAVKAFQKSKDLPETGLPDQSTLYMLFYP